MCWLSENTLGEVFMARLERLTVRTSERRVFRRCLRKWGFQSSKRRNLQRKGTEQNIKFWFGAGIHFAMEDYFGYNRFGDPVKAFQAYYAAFPAYDRPEGADEHYYLGLGMLEYFREWYPKHNQVYGFETVWLMPDGTEVEPGTPGARPLVEESFLLDLGLKCWIRDDTEEIVPDRMVQFAGDSAYIVEPGVLDPIPVRQIPIMYHGTLDRVVRDRLGRWWIMDYKTAKSADTNKLDTDDQISAYMWAAEQWFEHPIYGFMYVQLTKDVAKPPKRLVNGGISVDKKQKTTYNLVRQEIIKLYGDVRRAPANVIEYLNWLAEQETPEGDRFIRWDAVTRTREQKISTYYHILAETKMMIDPDLYLFPNPTRDCIWDCPFREACIMIDKGQHEQAERWLQLEFEQRPKEEEGNVQEWRERIPWPDQQNSEATRTMLDQIELSASQTLNIILPDKYRYLDEE